MGYTNPLFNVRTVTGGYKIFPDGVTTDDLYIYANPTDSYPCIILTGAYNCSFYVGNGSEFNIYNSSTRMIKIIDLVTSPEVDISSTQADHDLGLLTTGTGVLKFGTHVADAGSPVTTGYITIKDAGGTTRKLAVIS